MQLANRALYNCLKSCSIMIWAMGDMDNQTDSGAYYDFSLAKQYDITFSFNFQTGRKLSGIELDRYISSTPPGARLWDNWNLGNQWQSVTSSCQCFRMRIGAIHLWRPQKNHVFDPPVHMGRTSPLVDVHTRSTWNTHRSLEMASTMTYRT